MRQSFAFVGGASNSQFEMINPLNRLSAGNTAHLAENFRVIGGNPKHIGHDPGIAASQSLVFFQYIGLDTEGHYG